MCRAGLSGVARPAARHLGAPGRLTGASTPATLAGGREDGVTAWGDLLPNRLRYRAGVFRGGVDPVQFYITIASLGYFYLSNRHTLSAIFRRDLLAPKQKTTRFAHMIEVVLGYLRPPTPSRGMNTP